MNEEKEKIDAALAGQLLSVWMPYGLFRKVIFCVLIFFGAIGIITSNYWYHWATLIYAATMSPRLVGELAYKLGRLMSFASKIKK